MKNTSQNTNYHNRKMIDFLEDSNFRDWILKSNDRVDERFLYWKFVVDNHQEAKRAQYILKSLKIHFDKNSLTPEAIEDRLEQEIEKYRERGVISLQRRKRMVWIGRAAAVALLLIGSFFLLQWLNRPLEVYKTGFGEQLTIELPDASVIQLNSNSTLTWNRKWKEQDSREVTLNGEAFFKVEHIDGLPFQVTTDDITVNVTGTQFNVNSRRQKTMVYLEEGKVDVEVMKQPEKKYVMEPGEELVYQASLNQVEQKKVEAGEEISGWKEGLLIFRDEPLMKVLESVSDIYGKKFVTKDSALLHRNITTTIPLTNWDVSLTSIQLAMRLEVIEENDTIQIKEKE